MGGLLWGVSAPGGCLLLGGVCSEGVCSQGVSAPRGCLLWGVSAPGGVSAPRGGLCYWGVYIPSMH